MKRTIYYNGNVVTMDPAAPKASAVLCEDGRIAEVGSDEAILARKSGGTRLVNLRGFTLLPGFIDAHSHIFTACLYRDFSPPPIGDITSVDKLVEAMRAAMAEDPPKKGKWFVGRGYDNAAFPDGKHPTRYDLDRVSSTVPIALMHVSGHVTAVNSAALSELGVTRDTPDPEGGVIVRGADGEPTGVLEETASTQLLAGSKGLLPSLGQILGALDRAQRMYASYGITTAQDGMVYSMMLPVFGIARLMGGLRLDICGYAAIDGSAKSLRGVDSRVPKYRGHFRLGGAKLILDGSPQAKTAWLTQPYFKAPEGRPADYRGFPTYPDDDKVCGFFKECLENNWQILVHCNGDAAADQFITQYRRAMRETGIRTDLRPVMVHAQTVREDQLDAMKELGISPTFFHDHTYYWGDYHLDSVLGEERGSRISPLRSAADRGMNYTLHNDTPVTPPNMLLAVHNAVNRVTFAGNPIGQQYALTPMEALKAVTINGAWQYFEEGSKGSITPGKLADLVVLDRDPLEAPREKIREIRVLMTVKEDKEIYRAPVQG